MVINQRVLWVTRTIETKSQWNLTVLLKRRGEGARFAIIRTTDIVPVEVPNKPPVSQSNTKQQEGRPAAGTRTKVLSLLCSKLKLFFFGVEQPQWSLQVIHRVIFPLYIYGQLYGIHYSPFSFLLLCKSPKSNLPFSPLAIFQSSLQYSLRKLIHLSVDAGTCRHCHLIVNAHGHFYVHGLEKLCSQATRACVESRRWGIHFGFYHPRIISIDKNSRIPQKHMLT